MSFSVFRRLLEILDSGTRAVILTIHRGNGEMSKRFCLSEEDVQPSIPPEGLSMEAFRLAQAALKTGKLRWQETPDGSLLAEPVFPEPRFIVLGGGHIAKPLVEFGTKLGFQVTVCDDRPSFANRARFPNAHEVICDYFEKCFDRIVLNESAYVAIITRGHRHDMECYRKVASHDVAYVGMIGSHRRIAALKAQLLEEGISRGKLDLLNAPIGLDIGAVTPEEIALSIIAQVVGVRRKGSMGASVASGGAELDREVLEELSLESDVPRALVTIIGIKGSAPRKEGAKMLVWPDGRILGSIGGGCSEGEVLVVARDVIREGGFRVHRVDMTGSVAEDEGMACGGIMDVLIEAY
jgi:xanthine dehydrogenase accessory factor